ncbi:MAG TPA: hypothetical protein VKD72_36360 [Gemmataceae bacterium]|nr:hypothetical protein [Gemmataceae bacterium]
MTDYHNELEEVLHHAEEVEKEADELIEQVKRAEDHLKQAEDRPIEKILGDQGHIPDKKHPA